MTIEGKRNRSIGDPEILYSFIYFSPFIWTNPSFIALFRTKLQHPFVHNRDQLDRGIKMENPIDVPEIPPFLPRYTSYCSTHVETNKPVIVQFEKKNQTQNLKNHS